MSLAIDLNQLEARLRQHVNTLARTPRTPGSHEHRQAKEYIVRQLQDAGFVVMEKSHTEGGFTCINLFTEPIPKSNDLPLVVIGAHYDSVPDSPGADDNASAVAALLELARWIHPRLQSKGKARLQLAAYDLEEYGFIGSYLHCREIEEHRLKVQGMISLEMLGYTSQRPGSQQLPPHLVGLYPDVGNFIGICGNEVSRELVTKVTEVMKGVAGLPVEFIVVPGNGETLPPVRLSDHSSFWDHGHRALMITDTSFLRNPHYHQASDTPATLDYPFLAKVTAGVCQAVEGLLV